MTRTITRYSGLVEHYRARLPLTADTRAISLAEGRTPLIKLENLAREIGFEGELYVKFEGLNPTGSFKDRGMTVAVTQAVHEGARAIICASTGNTSAAAAAYAARAGITAFVLIPEGKIALGKLAQAVVHGAVVVQIRGNFDDGMRLVKEVAETSPVAIVNSINPFRLQGQKTAAFEIVEALGRAPDYHCIPVGNAGNITAYWKGFQESGASPRMLGFQAHGANPLVRGEMVPEPETIASAIRIGNPARWEEAMGAMVGSGGKVDDCTDEEILDAYRFLAREEGVFCEPASATSVAGLLKHGAGDAQRIVCVLTGHGLKDPQTALDESPPVIPCEPTLKALEKVLVG